jgi:outer membrane protein assembly factor BamB
VKRVAAIAALVGAAGVGLHFTAPAPAAAQRIDPRRAETLYVGAPSGPSPTDRIDAQRSGLTRTKLPTSGLRVAWRRSFGHTIDQTPLVLANGDIVLIAGRGDVVTLGEDGSERARTIVGAGTAGPPTVTSDGTIVLVTSTGEAVGVRRGAVRFRTRLGGERTLTGHVAPLSLDDGGVVVATSTELTALDAEGGVRARAVLPEPLATSLVASAGRLLAITTSGVVYAWTPGREPQRVGSFGAPVDGGSTLSDENTLVAVVEGTRLVALDLRRGTLVTRAQGAGTYYLGPPAMRAPTAYLLGQTPARTFVLAFDASGQETQRVLVATSPSSTLGDGGAAPFTVPAHVAPIVDRAGAVAFASPDGRVGVVANGAAEILGEVLCTRASAIGKSSGGVIGIAPATDAFLIACDSGALIKVVGQ